MLRGGTMLSEGSRGVMFSLTTHLVLLLVAFTLLATTATAQAISRGYSDDKCKNPVDLVAYTPDKCISIDGQISLKSLCLDDGSTNTTTFHGPGCAEDRVFFTWVETTGCRRSRDGYFTESVCTAGVHSCDLCGDTDGCLGLHSESNACSENESEEIGTQCLVHSACVATHTNMSFTCEENDEQLRSFPNSECGGSAAVSIAKGKCGRIDGAALTNKGCKSPLPPRANSQATGGEPSQTDTTVIVVVGVISGIVVIGVAVGVVVMLLAKSSRSKNQIHASPEQPAPSATVNVSSRQQQPTLY